MELFVSYSFFIYSLQLQYIHPVINYSIEFNKHLSAYYKVCTVQQKDMTTDSAFEELTIYGGWRGSNRYADKIYTMQIQRNMRGWR